ncbi:hypothetical protein SISNIDRAFT_463172 [Sistotremastrum niveocremeum HHB9708]|uniref:DUF7918 domain-containing protein n=1 Tax=Sistotremastrum niveocremeum HHB9708 TaxID=1314777 RepID=A0A164YU99_9AGAM|nr:hypothetical protein SISNIDRAFT_463172 [Sistotremastrum niveocremeum HHB9708]
MRFDDLEVWVEVDGQPLKEYGTRTGPGDTDKVKSKTTCYVASSRGKAFKVGVRDLRARQMPERAAYLYLDGSYVTSRFSSSRSLMDGCTMPNGLVSPFLFADMKLTDETRACETDPERIRNMGTVKISVDFVERRGVSSAPSARPEFKSLPMNERVKKGGGHCAVLGEPVLRTQSRRKDRDVVETIKGMPVIEFVFSYAPEDWLRAKNIITATLNPQPIPSTSNALKRRNPNIETTNKPNKSLKTSTQSRPSQADTGIKIELHDDELLEADDARLLRQLADKIKNKKKAQGIVKFEPLVPDAGLLRRGEVIDLTDD